MQKGADINHAKEVLAYETTRLVHGEAEAQKAQDAARALFGGGGDMENIPSTTLDATAFEQGMDILSLLSACSLIASKSEGRRLIQDGGIYLNAERVNDIDAMVTKKDFADGSLLLRKGKKIYHRVIIN